MAFARVAVPVPLGQAFTYSIPSDLAGRVVPGARVLCDFGRRPLLGVVLDVGDQAPDVEASKIKPVRSVVDTEPVLPAELLGFLQELARYYIAPIGEVMRLALPAVERAAKLRLADDDASGKLKLDAVGRLVKVAVPVAGAAAPERLRGQARDVLEHLLAQGPTPLSSLSQRWGNARAAAKKLESLDLVRIEERAERGDPFFAEPAQADTPPELNPAQREAVERISQALGQGRHHQFLLDGVTASGKTEVYLRVVQLASRQGGGAIVLVPEIALTPQLVARFRARIGDGIAVLHSGLTARERHTMWSALRSGELRVAVGARSALFAPVQDLKLIVVDEEHDGSFKQDEGVRYHARDMAILRAYRAGAVCVLGSATPSLASESGVRAGRLERLRLPSRAHREAVMPTVEVVDLRRVGPGPSGDRLISLPLYRALERVLEAKQQAILFLNRRGFSPSLQCTECGHIVSCPNCAVALTLHRSHGERLRCHYCDHSAPVSARCSECKNATLVEEGAGTEKVEQGLVAAFPGARIGRLDRDVAAGAKSEKILDRMRRGELDILVGTQMVTKGHDLPAVTLVGVLNADAALGMPDFYASERSFHLLVQVAGRAGRSGAPGTVFIQTRQPDHPAIRLAVVHDVAGFVEYALRERRELNYPPFSHVALVRLDAIDEAVARGEAERLSRVAHGAASKGVEILGPAPAPIARLRGRWRFRFMVRAAERAPLRSVLLAVARTAADRRVRAAIDVDPVNLL